MKISFIKKAFLQIFSSSLPPAGKRSLLLFSLEGDNHLWTGFCYRIWNSEECHWRTWSFPVHSNSSSCIIGGWLPPPFCSLPSRLLLDSAADLQCQFNNNIQTLIILHLRWAVPYYSSYQISSAVLCVSSSCKPKMAGSRGNIACAVCMLWIQNSLHHA